MRFTDARLFRALGLAVALMLIAPMALAHDPDKDDTPEVESSKAEPSAEGEAKKEDGKSFDAAVEEFEAIEGLFTFYSNADDGKMLMEIRPEQLETVYLCNVAREAGDGLWFDSGTMAGSFPLVFEKVGKKIRFVHKNVYFRADDDQPIARAIDRGVTNSILGTAEIVSDPHPERGSWLVDPAGFFLKDHLAISVALNSNTSAKRDYKFDKDESHFAWIKSFPQNSEIETVAHFTSSKPRATNMRIPDARSMEHRYRFSLSAVPESDYVPRFADDRVGHFLTMFQDYSSLERETPYTWYVERWNLKKANPNANSSKPVEPIIFWVENTVPHEYRASIREGALLWNQAFEEIGFKDAVVVKQMPDDADWDPADVRYNVIRWIVMPGGGYAVGPSSANPFTGELYAADIRISADYVRYMYLRYEELVNPMAAFADVMNGIDASPPQARSCQYGQAKVHDVAFGLDLLEARGFADTDSEDFKRYVHEAIVDLVAHEVGHTIGMRHNFRASTLHDLDTIHDTSKTLAMGVTGSVMDYNPVNLAPRGQTQGQYFHTTLGTYDKWAIEYAYTPIAGDPESQMEELEKIAARSSEPELAYGTDEDCFGFSAQAIDPTTNMWDLGNDPIRFYEDRLAMAGELLNGIEQSFAKNGARYQKHRSVFSRVMRNYFMAAATVPRFLGGMYHRRDHVGDPNGRIPFEPVSASEQRRALDFLKNHLFRDDALTIPASLANKLAPERLYDFDWSLYYQPRVDYPIHDAVVNVQRVALRRLYHPITLNRMLDFPLHVESGTEPLTMFQMFDEIAAAIWSEVEAEAGVNSFRRNLQRAHLGALVSLVVNPQGAPYYTPASGSSPAGSILPPEDACSFARANLVALQTGIEKALGSDDLDGETRAHLDESRARIVAALEASVQREL